MKLKKIAVMALAACFTWGGTAFAANIDINNANDLDDNSSGSMEYDMYDSNDYKITGQFSILDDGNSRPHITFNGNTWTVDSSAVTPTMPGAILTVKDFKQQSGEAYYYGGDTSFNMLDFFGNELGSSITINNNSINDIVGAYNDSQIPDLVTDINNNGFNFNAAVNWGDIGDGISSGIVLNDVALNDIIADPQTNIPIILGDIASGNGIRLNADWTALVTNAIDDITAGITINGLPANVILAELDSAAFFPSLVGDIMDNGLQVGGDFTNFNADLLTQIPSAMFATSDYIQDAGTYLQADNRNGDGFGLVVGGNFTGKDESRLDASGSHTGAGLYVVNDMTVNNALNYFSGGDEFLSIGAIIGNDYTANGSFGGGGTSFSATGGSGDLSIGALVVSNFTLNAGDVYAPVLSAQGGGGIGAIGLVVGENFTINAGQASFYGGSYGGALGGLIVGNFNQDLDTESVKAQGGNSFAAIGLGVLGNYNQNVGSFEAAGSNGGTLGIGAVILGDFTMGEDATSFTAQAGSGDDSYGNIGAIVGGNFIQNETADFAIIAGEAGIANIGMIVGNNFEQNQATNIAGGEGGIGNIGLIVGGNYEQGDEFTAYAGDEGIGNLGFIVFGDYMDDNSTFETYAGDGGIGNLGFIIGGDFIQDESNNDWVGIYAGASGMGNIGGVVAGDMITNGELYVNNKITGKADAGNGDGNIGLIVGNNLTTNYAQIMAGSEGTGNIGLIVGGDYINNYVDDDWDGSFVSYAGDEGIGNIGFIIGGDYTQKGTGYTDIYAGGSGVGNIGGIVAGNMTLTSSLYVNNRVYGINPNAGNGDGNIGLIVGKNLEVAGEVFVMAGDEGIGNIGLIVGGDYTQTGTYATDIYAGGSGMGNIGGIVAGNMTLTSSLYVNDRVYGFNPNAGNGDGNIGLIVGKNLEVEDYVSVMAGDEGIGNIGLIVGGDYTQTGTYDTVIYAGGSGVGNIGGIVAGNMTLTSSLSVNDRVYGFNPNAGNGDGNIGLIVGNNLEVTGTIDVMAGNEGIGNVGLIVGDDVVTGVVAFKAGNRGYGNIGAIIGGDLTIDDSSDYYSSITAGASGIGNIGAIVGGEITMNKDLTVTAGEGDANIGLIAFNDLKMESGDYTSISGTEGIANIGSILFGVNQKAGNFKAVSKGEGDAYFNVGSIIIGDFTQDADAAGFQAIAGDSGIGNMGAIIIGDVTQNSDADMKFIAGNGDLNLGGFVWGGYVQEAGKLVSVAAQDSPNGIANIGSFFTGNATFNGEGAEITGGDSIFAVGNITIGAAKQNAGVIEVNGGSGAGATGWIVGNGLYQTAGSLTINGGSYDAQFDIATIFSDLTDGLPDLNLNIESLGNVIASVSALLEEDGLTLANIQALLKSVNALGLSDVDTSQLLENIGGVIANSPLAGSHGAIIIGGIDQSGDITINAGTGGSAMGAIVIGDHIQRDGELIVKGTTKDTAVFGMGEVLTGSYYQLGGTAEINGGAAKAGNGMLVIGSVNQNAGASMVINGGSYNATLVDIGDLLDLVLGDGDLSDIGGILEILITDLDDSQIFGSHGLVTIGGVNQYGDIEANGGTGTGALGILSVGEYVINNGTLNANGGSAGFTSGVLAVQGFTQNGGMVTATGGSYNATSGLLSSPGDISGSHGIFVLTGNYALNQSGKIVAKGGTGNYATGLRIGTFVTDGKLIVEGKTPDIVDDVKEYVVSIEAEGGAGKYAYGIMASAGADITNAVVKATGGSAQDAFGMYAGNDLEILIIGMAHTAKDITLTGSSVTAAGGSGSSAHGIYASNITSSKNYISATGGSGSSAHGIATANNFTATNSAIIAQGGSAANAAGIYIGRSALISNYGNMTITGSNVSATGGSANKTYGIYVHGAVTNASTVSFTDSIISAFGNDGANATGMYVNRGSMTVANSNLIAAGGKGDNASGIYLNHNNADFIATDTVIADFDSNGKAIAGAVGGTGKDAVGIYAKRDFNLSSTTNDLKSWLMTAGGAGNNAYGVYVGRNANFTNAPFITAGGAGKDAVGLYVKGNATSNYGVPYNDDSPDWLDFDGGKGENAHGAYIGGNFTNQNLAITAFGGKGKNAIGLLVNKDFTHTVGKIDPLDINEGTNGYIIALAGEAESARGIQVNGNWSSTNAYIEASGSAYTNAAGIDVAGNFSHVVDMRQGGYYSTPRIDATAGNAAGAYGIYAGGNFAAANTVIEAIGVGTTGIYVGGNFTFTGDEDYALIYGVNNPLSIKAQGGDSTGLSGWAEGIYVRGNFSATNANIIATGGNGPENDGIYVEDDFTITIADDAKLKYTSRFTGGTGDWAHGLNVDNYTQNGDVTVVAKGGGLTDGLEYDDPDHVHNLSHGINVDGNATQNGGVIIAIAGDIDGYAEEVYIGDDPDTGDPIYETDTYGSYGIYVDYNFTQTGSTLVGKGSEADYGVGAYIAGNLIQAGADPDNKVGKIIAVGGKGVDAYGIYVGGMVDIDNYLKITRKGEAASMYIANNNYIDDVDDVNYEANRYGLTFRDDSTLWVEADWLNDPTTTGLIVVENGDVLIGKNVGIEPEIEIPYNPELEIVLVNSAAITPGNDRTIVFMETLNGNIFGEFGNNTEQTLTLKFGAKKYDDDTKYAFSAERIANPEDIVAGWGAKENTLRLLNGMTNGLPNALVNTPDSETTIALSKLYSQLDSFVAGEEADMAAYAAWMQKGLTPHATTRLIPFALQQYDAVQQQFNYSLADISKMEYIQLWATGIYQSANSIKADTHEFDKAKERFAGGVFGIGKDINNWVTLAAQFHYLTGKVTTSENNYKAESDSYGITIGARFHDIMTTESWNPWIETNFAYSKQSIDQHRTALDYSRMKSSPDSDLFRFAVEFGNSFVFSNNVTLTPSIGLEYTHIRQDSYSEKGDGLFGLHVNKANFDSLRPKIGAEISFGLAENFTLSAHGYYRYELLDSRVTLKNTFMGSPDVHFSTKGQKISRSSGNLGLGLAFQITEKISLGVDYNLWLKEHYIGHQGTAEFKIGF